MSDPRSGRPELLTAYLDGVGELDTNERHDVETWLREQPTAATEADDTRALLGQLRALPATPPGSNEPSWSALAATIAAAVPATAPARASWRRTVQRWLVPGLASVTAAAGLVLWVHAGPPVPTRSVVQANGRTLQVIGPAPAAPAAPAAPVASEPAPAPATTTVAPAAVWLDGHAVELDDVEDPMAVVDAVGDMFAADPMATADVPTGMSNEDAEASAGLLPTSDLAWIDELDASAIDRLDGWLRRTKG